MQRKTIWRWSAAIVGGLLAIGACSDDNSVAPKTAPQTPLFLQNSPFNGNGACLALDAYNAGFTSGVTSATTLADPNQHCTSNDIRVAHADLIEWSPDSISFFPVPQAGLTCLEGDVLFVHLHSDIHETATSERTDIGMWISTDGGNARTGTCNHYNLVTPPTKGDSALGVTNIDGDHCGDMNNADSTSVDIGTIRVVCQTATPTSTSLHVGACLGWTQPGGDQVCPQSSIEDGTHYRYGTVPGTTSKCNCEGFDIPVTVQRTAKLEVMKACTPANDAGTFDLLIDDSNSHANNVSCGGSTGAQTLSAGTNVNPGAVHTFGEGDFNTANYVSSYACVDRGTANSRGSGTSLGPNDITLQPNDDVVCTYTNVRKPNLTLVKVVSNDNGGAKTVSDFPLTAAGPVTISGVSGTTAVTGRTVSAGTYALTEQNQAGYTPGSWSCTGGTQNGANITLPLGGSATCTIHNDDNAPGLTLVKVVTNNNGGNKTPADFPLTASGPVTISGASGTTAVTNRLVSAGTYALSEQTLAGYGPTSWSCTGNGTLSGANITIGLGGAATCTIGNNDIGPHLTLVKFITNDNGGTKVGSDFPLTATGPVPPSCTPGSIIGATGSPSITNAEMCAGTYALSEQTQSGYAPSAWSCTGGSQSGSNITLGLASSATCTIGNNDIAPHLTLVKVVTNDNGGTKTLSNFPLTATGPTNISGVSGTSAVTGRAVGAGTYTLSEQTQAGYAASTWSCSGGSQSGSSISLALGGAATCTISNNDIAPKLIIKKVVKGAGSSFGFTATGGGIVSPFNLNPPTDGADSVVYPNATAGAFSVTEDAKSGYLLTDLGCSDQTKIYDPATTRTVIDTLSLGETVTCTFVNEAIALTTRTQGFWATHESITNAVWFGGTIGGNAFGGVTDKTLCGRTLSTTPIVLGGFWSNIAQETDHTKRSSLDRSRMQLLQQLLAAILNNAAFGSSPSGMSITAAKAAYCGIDETLIKQAQTAMAQFNESGDNGLFTPGVSANGKQAKTDADLGFWDTLP